MGILYTCILSSRGTTFDTRYYELRADTTVVLNNVSWEEATTWLAQRLKHEDSVREAEYIAGQLCYYVPSSAMKFMQNRAWIARIRKWSEAGKFPRGVWRIKALRFLNDVISGIAFRMRA
jgi:hypothetical protein